MAPPQRHATVSTTADAGGWQTRIICTMTPVTRSRARARQAGHRTGGR